MHASERGTPVLGGFWVGSGSAPVRSARARKNQMDSCGELSPRKAFVWTAPECTLSSMIERATAVQLYEKSWKWKEKDLSQRKSAPSDRPL